jgi:hypothetical protein
MRTLALVLAGAALALSFPAAAKSVTERGDAQVALILGSRTPGTPVKCINTLSARRDALQIVDGFGLIFKAADGTIYVSRATDPAKLRSTDVERLDQVRTTQLCSSDRIWTYDRFNGSLTGVVGLTDFVPYTRAG